MSEWQHHFAEPSAGGLYLQSLRSGEGKPLLLLIHGIGDWGESMRPLAEALSKDFDLLIPDLRGHGFSPRYASYNFSDYAGDLLALINSLGEPLTLYGHSLGGLLALWLSSHVATQINGCALEDPPIFHLQNSIHQRPEVIATFQHYHDVLQAGKDPQQLLAALIAAAPQRPLAQLRKRAIELLRMDPAVWDPILRNSLCADLPVAAEWPTIQCPLTIFAADAERGAAMQPADEAIAKAYCQGARIVRYSGASHNVRKSHLPAIADELAKFR